MYLKRYMNSLPLASYQFIPRTPSPSLHLPPPVSDSHCSVLYFPSFLESTHKWNQMAFVFLSGLFHLTLWSLDPMLLSVSGIQTFLWWSNIMFLSNFIYTVTHMWNLLDSMPWLFWIELHYACRRYRYIFNMLIPFPLVAYPVELIILIIANASSIRQGSLRNQYQPDVCLCIYYIHVCSLST